MSVTHTEGKNVEEIISANILHTHTSKEKSDIVAKLGDIIVILVIISLYK